MRNTETATEWVTLNVICEHLGRSRATVNRWIIAGLPKHQPAGKGGDLLFDIDEVDAWVRSRCSPHAGDSA